MKNIVKIMIFTLCIYFIVCGLVKAETFYEGKFINGEYINKVIDGKTYFMTMQFIKDSQGDIVYCLEPFVTFEEGKSYISYIGDLTGYKNLTSKQKRQIELITYYGYGYGNRTSNKWYVVTQYLIWKTVDNSANIYFTKTLNGTKIVKYEKEMEQILIDVNNHDKIPAFVKDYTVNLGDSFKLKELDSNYEIVSSDFKYEFNNGYETEKVSDNGIISFKKKSNYYKNKIAIFDSSKTQDLIRPGNIDNNVLKIKVNVTKGDIVLDIKDDDGVYTVESDLTNTCYEIDDGREVIDRICTGKEAMIYKTGDLPYGNYNIKQVNVGIGYKKDINLYTVSINKDNIHPVVTLYNYLIKNKIEIIKWACKNYICNYEENALFNVFDKNNNLVDSIITDDKGYTLIELGYGTYHISQKSGLKEYTLADSFSRKIVDEETVHKKELFNYYIEKEPVVEIEKEEEIPVLEETEEIVLPPKTRVDKSSFITKMIEIFKKWLKVIFENSYII